jgi:hypothetical protein
VTPLTRCLTALTDFIRCPGCKTTQRLDECEVAGIPEGRVACGRCFKVFWPVVVTIQESIFEDDGDE